MSWLKRVAKLPGIKKDSKRISNLIIQNAEWRQDCGKKQDFDIDFLSISTRYYGGDHTAYPTLMVRFSPTGEYLVLAKAEIINLHSEAEVKAAVEAWAHDKIRRTVEALLETFEVDRAEYEEKMKHVLRLSIVQEDKP